MKKTKIFLIIFTIIFIVAAIVVINVGPLLSMKPVETGEILNTGIYAIQSGRNSLFLIQAEDGYIMIDAGSGVNAVESALNQMSVEASDIKYVLLTHSDSDHAAALALFPNAQIFLSEDEKPMLDGSMKRNIFGSNSLPDGVDLKRFILLTDGQELKWGEHSIECIKSPGHTPGSMSYLLDGTYLFTGDALKISNNAIAVHPYTMDKKTAEDSIQRLNDIPGNQYVITAHYGYYRADELKEE